MDASAAPVDGPALVDKVESRLLGSAFFHTVFTLVNTLLNLFSLSLGGTDGPSWAGELMVVGVPWVSVRYGRLSASLCYYVDRQVSLSACLSLECEFTGFSGEGNRFQAFRLTGITGGSKGRKADTRVVGELKKNWEGG